jgi:uncharacterized protein
MKDMFIDLAKYRIQRAFENRTDAMLLLKSDQVIDSVNRLYMANFFAVKSLLATKMVDSTKQRRVLHIFQEKFVQSGEVPIEYSQILDRSYRSRDEGEQRRDSNRISRQEAQSMIDESEKFICFARNYLQEIILANPEKASEPLKVGEDCESKGRREPRGRK